VLIFMEIEEKAHEVLEDILNLAMVAGDEVMRVKRSDGSLLLLDLIKANQVINWFLKNSEVRLKIKKANGHDASQFEHIPEFKAFLCKHLGIREGQKWVIEQKPGDTYIALRKAMANEVKAYNIKEDIIDAEPDRIVRIINLGIDISIESIDFKYALQYQ